MTAALFPTEPNWKRTHRSAVCKRQQHDKCRAYGCGCHCHVVDFADDEENE